MNTTEESKQPSSTINTSELSNINDKQKLRCVKVNTTRSRNELKLFKILIPKIGWKETFGTEGEVCWTGMLGDDDYSIAEKIPYNRVPGISRALDKDTIARIFKMHQEIYPDTYDFIPDTFILPEDIQALEAYMKENPNKTIILKPSEGSMGLGIKLTRNFNDIRKFINNCPGTSVAQAYINDPYTLMNRKFDLRLHVLIASYDPLTVFLNQYGLVRLCSEDYTEPNDQNMRNAYMHLTNNAINSVNHKIHIPDDNGKLPPGIKMELQDLWKDIDQKGYDSDKVKDDVSDLIRKTMEVLCPFIQMNYISKMGANKLKCFHMVGFDVLIDQDLKPWLIEINAIPSTTIDDPDPTQKTIPKIEVDDTDWLVKSNAIGDAILLVTRKKTTVDEADEDYRSYKYILNQKNGDIDKTIFVKAADIFVTLMGFKKMGYLTSKQFSKVKSHCHLPCLTESQMELIFTKVMSPYKSKQMEFMEFLEGLKEACVKCKQKMTDIL